MYGEDDSSENEGIANQLYFLEPKCFTCNVSMKETPQMRRALFSHPYLHQNVFFCNKHGLRAKKGHLCKKCLRVFRKKDMRVFIDVVVCNRCGEINDKPKKLY